MTDQTQDTAGEAPAPDAAPAPVPAPWEVPPPQAQPAADAQEEPVTPPEDQSGRAGELEAELAKIRADALKGAKVLLRVLKPHISFTHGGITVGSEPTPVPARALGTLMEAAGEAGVKLEEA
jgi:hypothetical protein